MQLTVYISLPLSANLAEFSQYLRQQSVPHKIIEQNGEQQLWAQNEASLQTIAGQYKNFIDDGKTEKPVTAAKPKHYLGAAIGYLLLFPITIGSILLSCVIAIFTWYFSESLLHVFLFQDVTLTNNGFVFLESSLPWNSGEYWRFITPVFLHFGWMHLVFNSLWMWEFGRRIEQRQGQGRILLLLLIVGAVSNIAQYIWAGSALFGGLSGVIYGLAGYCWLWAKLRPSESFNTSDSLFYGLVAIMLIMMTGIFNALGLGEIANTAHLIGLVSGLVCAVGLSLITTKT